MKLLIVQVIFALISTGLAIDCFDCSSNTHSYCAEYFDESSNASPSNCSGIFEARFCVKTTGMYDGERGTKRFCSSRDMGNYCEFATRPGDEGRKYRSCVYTCYSDGCNSSERKISNISLITSILVLVLSLSVVGR